MDAKLRALIRRVSGGDEAARVALQRGLLRAGLPVDAAWGGLPLEDLLDWGECERRLTSEGLRRLREDVASIAASRLVHNAPRDAQGRLELKARVLLASYPAREALSRDRDLWLVAALPDRRRDPQVISMALESLIGRNQAHNWERAPYAWSARVEPSEEAVWGAAGIPWKLVNARGEKTRAKAMARLVKACGKGQATRGERVALCVLLQEEGRWVEALQLFDVEVHDSVPSPGQAVVDEIRSKHGGGGVVGYDDRADRACLESALRESAPWRFAAALDLEAERVAGLKTARPIWRRLLWLPNQPQQSKMSLFLLRDRASGRSRLELAATASNDRLPTVLWKRPPPCAAPPLLRFNEEPLPSGAQLQPFEVEVEEHPDPDPEEEGGDPWASVRGTPWDPGR
jgi:hypothetical protein